MEKSLDSKTPTVSLRQRVTAGCLFLCPCPLEATDKLLRMERASIPSRLFSLTVILLNAVNVRHVPWEPSGPGLRNGEDIRGRSRSLGTIWKPRASSYLEPKPPESFFCHKPQKNVNPGFASILDGDWALKHTSCLRLQTATQKSITHTLMDGVCPSADSLCTGPEPRPTTVLLALHGFQIQFLFICFYGYYKNSSKSKRKTGSFYASHKTWWQVPPYVATRSSGHGSSLWKELTRGFQSCDTLRGPLGSPAKIPWQV